MAIGVDFIYGVMQLLKLIPKGAEADANDYIDMLGQLFEFVHLEIFFIIILTSTQSYLSISYMLAMTLLISISSCSRQLFLKLNKAKIIQISYRLSPSNQVSFLMHWPINRLSSIQYINYQTQPLYRIVYQRNINTAMNKNHLRIKINSKKIDHGHATKSSRGQIGLSAFVKMATSIISSKSSSAFDKLQYKLKDTPITFVVPEQLKREHLLRISSQKERSAKSVTKHESNQLEKMKNSLSELDEQKLKSLVFRKSELMERLRRIDYHLMNPKAQAHRQQHILTNQSKITEHSRLNYLREKGDASAMKLRQQQIYDINKHEKTMQMLTRLNHQKLQRQEKIISTMKIKQLTQIKKLEQIQRNRSQLSLSRNVNHTNNVNFKINTKEKERQSEPSKDKLPPFDEISQIQPGNINQFEQLELLPVSHHSKETITSSHNDEKVQQS